MINMTYRRELGVPWFFIHAVMLYWSKGFPSISCLSLHSSMKAEPSAGSLRASLHMLCIMPGYPEKKSPKWLCLSEFIHPQSEDTYIDMNLNIIWETHKLFVVVHRNDIYQLIGWWCPIIPTAPEYYVIQSVYQISWLFNVSGPMVRHNCHGLSISTHPSLFTVFLF